MSTAAERIIRVTLYGRAECHLCHEMRAVVDAVARDVPLEVEEVDVDGDPALVAAYGDEVPVLCVNGRRAFKYRVDESSLRLRLSRETS
ncbi:MAG: glutaredoxin family protein [Candidatus Binatia bacterium]